MLKGRSAPAPRFGSGCHPRPSPWYGFPRSDVLSAPIRDELRVAVHGLTRPPEIGLTTTLDSILGGFEAGFTASNRLFLEALHGEGFVLGPELDVQVETWLEGPVVVATLGLSGGLSL